MPRHIAAILMMSLLFAFFITIADTITAFFAARCYYTPLTLIIFATTPLRFDYCHFLLPLAATYDADAITPPLLFSPYADYYAIIFMIRHTNIAITPGCHYDADIIDYFSRCHCWWLTLSLLLPPHYLAIDSFTFYCRCCHLLVTIHIAAIFAVITPLADYYDISFTPIPITPLHTPLAADTLAIATADAADYCHWYYWWMMSFSIHWLLSFDAIAII